MNTDEQHATFMERAIGLAKRSWGQTHPNPIVGAVIVEQGEVVAEGWHRMAGQPHAEVEALQALGRKPRAEATLYVTLEPCSTQGRTGACTDAILESGIKNLVVGAIDPNPDHRGRGLERLRNAGVNVVEGVLADECADLNLIFNHWVVHKQPLIAMKVALTLDGKFTTGSQHERWVTGEPARQDVMRWRRYFPAIAVGANTVLSDNPSLTSRLDGPPWCPKRFVLDRLLKTVDADPLPALYSDAHKEQTIVLCSAAASDAARSKLARQGVVVWELPEADGHLDLMAFRERCAGEGICGVYFEPGPELATALLGQQIINYVFIYQAPKFLNDSKAPGMGSLRATQSMDEMLTLQAVRHASFGSDVLIRGHIRSYI